MKDKDIEFPRAGYRFLNSMGMSRYKQGNQAHYDVPHSLLGPLPQYETPKIEDGDPATQLVTGPGASTKSKRIQIREELNKIYDIPSTSKQR